MKNQNLQQPVVGGRPVHRNVFASHLMQTLILLTAMVMGGMNCARAATLYSKVTLTSNTTASTELATYTLSGINSGDIVQAEVNGENKNFYKLGNNEAFVRIEFTNGGDHFRFMPGDILTVTMLKCSTGKAGYCLKNITRPNVEKEVEANTPTEVTRTLTADDIDDDGKLTIFRSNSVGYDCRYYQFSVHCVRYGNDIFVSTNDASKGSAKLQVTEAPNNESNVSLNTDAVAASASTNSRVKFTATPADGKLFWYWKKNGVASYDATNPITVTVNGNLDYQAVFSDGVKHYVYTNNAEIGTVKITRDGSGSYTQLHVNPGTPNISFVATEVEANSFVGWYTNADRTTPAPDGDNCTYLDKTYKLNGSQLNSGLTLFAKFTATTYVPSCDWGGSGFIQVLSPTSANAGIAPFSVKMGGAPVDKSNYTLSYAVKSGPISVTSDGKITVNSEDASVKGLKDGYSTPVDAYITVTATPNNHSFNAGSVDLKIQIKAVTNGVVKLNPSEVRIGDYFDVTVERGTGFPNIKYYWTFPENTTNVYGYTGTAVVQEETTRDGIAIPYQFLAIGATSGKMDIYARIESQNTATEYKGLYGSGITIKPITIPNIEQDGSDVVITYEEDFVNRKGEDVDAFLEYKIGDGSVQQTGFGNNASTFTIKDLAVGTIVTAKSVVRFKKTDDPSQFVYVSSNEVAYTVRKPFQIINVNGTERQYDLHIPEGMTSGGTVGIVISLHNGGEDVSVGTNGRVYFNNVADQYKNDNDKKFVVVSPRALIRGGVRDWQLDERSTDDTEFFKAIVKKINDDNNGLTVDYNRIYLAGYGTGGAMAFKVAHKDADFYSAIASVSGVPYDDSHLWHAGKKPVPFLFIQGRDDGIFSQIGPQNVTTITHNMMYRNGAAFAATSGTITINNNDVVKDCHEAEAGGAAFYHYTVPAMRHMSEWDWDNDSKDDVAPTMWAFFNKDNKVVSLDETLKFRVNDPSHFWGNAGNYGFENVNTDTSVLTYGGATKTDGNKNIYHSLQFNGGINGAAHFLKLNVHTDLVQEEDPNQYFLVKLTKTGASTPVFAKRYQAGRGTKDLYINFAALPGLNEYKLEVTKSRSDLVVKVHGMEFYSGRCEDKSQEENHVFFYDVASVLTGMNPIYQPVYGKSYNGIAKEYLPIAEIPVGKLSEKGITPPSDITDTNYKVIEDNLKNSDAEGAAVLPSLPSTVVTNWGGSTTTISRDSEKIGKLFNIAISGKYGEDTDHKSNNAFIFVPNGETYNIDKVKGINISQHGRAEMPEYLNGTRGNFPTQGMIAIKVQGTLDFYLLAQNEIEYDGSDPNPARRTLKVYYTNDQLDGELKELKEWWFFGTRSENGFNDKKGNSLASLSANIRLPQLGKDGTCTVFITYEGDGQGQSFSDADTDHDKIWIKGFVIKRPDLKVTIGRTDEKYKDQNRGGEENTKLTRFGVNKPYIWSFDNVGFNNTKYSDHSQKKVNENDWRTYVCGGTDDSFDHLLIYSDIESKNGNDKAQFDGRVAGQEHIEFRKPSQYLMKDNPDAADHGRMEFNPITSNGLKVNVTGSGWFKIKCSAPNGKVKMKVYSSTNYGISYTNLLREFIVDNQNHPVSATGEEEHRWGEYTVYLKGHVERTWNDTNKKLAGFWDGDKIKYSEDEGDNAEEKVRMSLYVVFDKISGESYKEDRNQSGADASPQLNIHELSWLNEEPADYVFQREEDPKLLTTWQEIKRNGETILYWKAGNDDDNEYTMLKENGNDTYNRLSQTTTNISGSKGVNSKSPGGYASTSVPSDAGTYDAYWDIAAPASTNAHTEKAYGGTPQYNSNTEYINNGANNTEFDTPVSGSFIRICAMKNTYVAAHVIPGVANGYVYVLDETGAPIGFDGSTDDGKRRGYIATMLNVTDNSGDKKSDDATIRIDFCANAGKEYFICAKDASISLARLEVQDWRYKPTKSSTTLALVDGQNNSSAISTAYSSNEFYRDATLARKLTKGYWISLVLPFSMNEKKFKEVFGENARCIHFSGMDFDNKIVKLTHHYYNMIVAGRPVFVRPDIDILKTNPLEINDITLQTNIVRPTVIKTEKGNFTFTGSYDMQPIEQNDLFINNNQMTYLNITSSSYPGMRSFIQNGPHYNFETNTTPGQVGAKVMFLEFYDATEDIPTEVMEIIGSEFGKNVIVVTKSTKVYDLNGRVVAEGANISNLPAGIYIVNGKKYIVK